MYTSKHNLCNITNSLIYLIYMNRNNIFNSKKSNLPDLFCACWYLARNCNFKKETRAFSLSCQGSCKKKKSIAVKHHTFCLKILITVTGKIKNKQMISLHVFINFVVIFFISNSKLLDYQITYNVIIFLILLDYSPPPSPWWITEQPRFITKL